MPEIPQFIIDSAADAGHSYTHLVSDGTIPPETDRDSFIRGYVFAVSEINDEEEADD